MNNGGWETGGSEERGGASPERGTAERKAQPPDLFALSEVLAVVDIAGRGTTGKSTPKLIYFAAKDSGRKRAAGYDYTDDVEKALQWVFPPGKGGWKVSLWKNKSDRDYWVVEDGYMLIRLLFADCPVREACLRAGIDPGGIACHAVHGQAAGMMEEIFRRPVEQLIEHCGPAACLVLLRTTLE